MQRRDTFKLFIGGGIAAARPALAAAPHPVLWRVRRGDACTHMLGFADAKDRSWYTPLIQNAFDDSGEIWFEVPQPNPAAPPPAPPKAENAPDPGASDRDLFALLPERLSARLLAAADKYGVPREKLAHVKPWRAFFVLNSGYLSRTDAGKADLENFADIVLSRAAYAAGKTVRSEFATGTEAMAHFINMPEAEAVERLEFLLDFLDDDAKGAMPDRYDWIEGRNNTRGIDRMRTRWPLLYQDEQVNRNVAWAKRIDGFLNAGGNRFVVIGLQHTLGPDSIPVQLRKLGMAPEAI